MLEDDDFRSAWLEPAIAHSPAEDCLIHHFGHGSFSKLEPAESTRIFEENRPAADGGTAPGRDVTGATC